MTDRELLELAAKAAGADWAVEEDGSFEILSEIGGVSGYWNPITDDGDALRLAVKLQMGVWTAGCKSAAAKPLFRDEFANQPYGDDDPYADTRHAIVRAAAEIGRAM